MAPQIHFLAVAQPGPAGRLATLGRLLRPLGTGLERVILCLSAKLDLGHAVPAAPDATSIA